MTFQCLLGLFISRAFPPVYIYGVGFLISGGSRLADGKAMVPPGVLVLG